MTEPADSTRPEPNSESTTTAAPDDATTDGATGSTPQNPAQSSTGKVSYLFLALLSGSILVTDLLTKWWAESTLSDRPPGEPAIVLIEDVLAFHLAYNKGGAFGMFADENDVWRAPFFLVVSFGAVAFIVSLYRKLQPGQTALRWGLPLVLGGALGNLADRLTRGKVVDFIDYQATWVQWMNELIVKVNDGWHVTRHWPTFNVADMGICVGIGLMALDMFFHQKRHDATSETNQSSGPPPTGGRNDGQNDGGASGGSANGSGANDARASAG